MSAQAIACALAAIGGVSGMVPSERLRLVGHEATLEGGALIVRDIAGEGPPMLGCVERRDGELWLLGDGRALRLEGPLAVPRIAGPGYRVWVIGEERDGALDVERIGILRRPTASRGCEREPTGASTTSSTTR